MFLAMRSMRAMGFLLMAVGVISTLPMMLGTGTRGLAAAGLISFLSFMIYLLPGVLYFVFATYISRRRFWAVVAGICLASIHAIFAVLGIVGLATLMLTMSERARFIWIPIGLCGLMLVALVQLLSHLVKTFEAIKYLPSDAQRGFEPLMPATPAQVLQPHHSAASNPQQSGPM